MRATLSSIISANRPVRFGIAFLVTFLALLLVRVTNLFAGDASAYFAALAAAALSSCICGCGPAVLSVAISAAAIGRWFVLFRHFPQMTPAREWAHFIGFLALALLIVAIGAWSARERRRLRDEAGTLEEMVKERTNELNHANHSLRQLTARLLSLQDDERRRIARELHDNAGQALSAIGMNLSSVARDLESLRRTSNVVADSVGLVRQMSDDIRTMSYLLHPPLLDEMGLASALTWYIEGFTRRSGIAVNLKCPDDFGRLPQEVETTIFRLVQECLTNIHRHSGSPTAAIQLTRSRDGVRLEVRDEGKGIPPEKRLQLASGGTLGVGVQGMRERVGQLGGSLEISSGGAGKGTRIVMQMPAGDARPSAEISAVAQAGGQA